MSDEKRPWELWDKPGIAHEINKIWKNDSEAIYRLILAHHVSKYVRKGEKFLEVGCGSGYFYNFLRKLAEVDYTGIDTSDEMLTIARMTYPGVKFQKGDGYHLDFPDNSFDAVAAIDVLQHVPDLVTMIRELKRVARRIYFFTLVIADKTNRGWETILGTQFIYNVFTQRDANEQVKEATGGTPFFFYSSWVNRSVIWVVAKNSAIDLGQWMG